MAGSGLKVNNGKLSYILQEAKQVPVALSASLGEKIIQLDLSDNCISSLIGMDQFLDLEEVVLDCNGLTEEILATLPYLPKVHTLSLNKNKLKDLDRVLEIVKKCVPSLKYLSLLGNEACPDQLTNRENDEDDYDRYRLYVLYKLPQLRFLDSAPFRESDRTTALQKGPYLRVVKLADEELAQQLDSSAVKDEPIGYQPLPLTSGSASSSKATFGKCRYVYYGRHSEGNRFIRNNDL